MTITVELSQNGSVEVEAEAEAIFQSLVTDALNLPGDHGIPHKFVPAAIGVADLDKLREGRAFGIRHQIQIGWATTAGEIVVQPVQRTSSVIFRNELFNSSLLSFMRMLRTVRHAFTWMGDEIENPSSVTAMDVYKIRKIHADYVKKLALIPPAPAQAPKGDYRSILKAIRADLAHISTPDYVPQLLTTSPAVLISQFDLALSLLIIYFVLDMNPAYAGLTSADAEGINSFVYYVGIVGRYLGIEDRFNVALHPNPEVRRAVLRRVSSGILAPCFKEMPEPDFLTFLAYAEKYHLSGLFQGTMHTILKDVLGVGPAKHTEAFTGVASRGFQKSVQVMLYFLSYSWIQWTANAGATLLRKGLMSWLEWKTSRLRAAEESVAKKKKREAMMSNNKVEYNTKII